MMEELQSQRALLEKMSHQRINQGNLAGSSKGEIAKVPTKNRKPSMSQAGSANPKMSHENVTQSKMMWCLEESDVEVCVEEEEVEIVSTVPRPNPSSTTAQKAIPFEEWGTHTVSWGKKHKGKSYEATIRVDPGYFEWCQSRYLSLTPEMQDFVRYGQLRMARLAAEVEAAEIDP